MCTTKKKQSTIILIYDDRFQTERNIVCSACTNTHTYYIFIMGDKVRVAKKKIVLFGLDRSVGQLVHGARQKNTILQHAIPNPISISLFVLLF